MPLASASSIRPAAEAEGWPLPGGGPSALRLGLLPFLYVSAYVISEVLMVRKEPTAEAWFAATRVRSRGGAGANRRDDQNDRDEDQQLDEDAPVLLHAFLLEGFTTNLPAWYAAVKRVGFQLPEGPQGLVVLLLIECFALALCYARFDVLTVLWASFTFSLCALNSFLFVMFEPTGATEQWIAFVVYGLFVLAAGVITFKSPLRAGFRRVAAVFE